MTEALSQRASDLVAYVSEPVARHSDQPIEPRLNVDPNWAALPASRSDMPILWATAKDPTSADESLDG